MGTRTAKKSPIRERPLRLPGQGLDERLRDLVLDDGLNYLLPAALSWAIVIGSTLQDAAGRFVQPWMFIVVAALVSVWAFAGFTRILTLSRALKLGRQGERHVGQLLQTLDLPGTRVFHDIPGEGFNLDHVVVCDRGIYVVETKTWSKAGSEKLDVKDGSVLIGGRPVRGNPVGQVAAAARWLREVLEGETGHTYECQPVVVLPGWYVNPMDAATKAMAWVLEPKALLKWIRNDAIRLQPEDIRRIEGAISRHVRRHLGNSPE